MNQSETITFEDFMKVDLRVAKIISAERIEGTKNLIKLVVDVGEKEPRQIIAGIAKWYDPKELVEKLIIVVKNLQPKKIKGHLSQGMLLAADAPDKPILLTVMEPAPPGCRVR